MRTLLAVAAVLVACSGASPNAPADASVADAPAQDAADVAGPARDAPDVDAADGAAPADVVVCSGGASAPEARGDGAGVVDARSGRLVIFGGDVGPTRNCTQTSVFRDDTWRYDPRCDRWTAVTGDHPSARSRMAYALDSRRGRMLIFGGRFRAASSGNYTLNREVWALDLAAGTWAALTPTNDGPTARANASAVYDATADELVVYGGNTSVSGASFTPQRDAWALSLDALAWRRVSASGPPARLFHAAAIRDRTMWVAMGGDAMAFTGPFLRDAWTLDLATGAWSRVPLASDESDLLRGRINSALAPSPSGGVVMVAGHDDGALGNRNDVLGIGDDGAVTALRAGDTLQHAGMGFCNFPSDFATADMAAPERRSAFVFAVGPTADRAMVYGGKTDCGLAGDVWSVDLGTGAWTTLRGTNDGLSCARSGRSGCAALCE